ncbi:MAG: hypothetical protein N4A72_22090 [Bacteroidales bacterium]|jgi:hypothetical protein|nr:hypothetical protein [Bacteroidales bacterium]
MKVGKMNGNHKTLKLTINREWFISIATLEKSEEYREIKPYWLVRLFRYKSGKKIKQNKNAEQICEGLRSGAPVSKFDIEPIDYREVQFFNGAHFSEQLPTIKTACREIKVKHGNVKWGAEEGKRYFTIELGDSVEAWLNGQASATMIFLKQ